MAAGIVIAFAFVLGGPILVIPILLLLPGPIVAAQAFTRLRRIRQVKRFRQQAKAQKTSFEPADRDTLA